MVQVNLLKILSVFNGDKINDLQTFFIKYKTKEQLQTT